MSVSFILSSLHVVQVLHFFLRWVQMEPTQILAVAGYKAKGRIQIAANLLVVNSSERAWNYENMKKKNTF